MPMPFLLLALLLAAPISADFIDGHKLSQWLAAKAVLERPSPTGAEHYAAFTGQGYVMGVADVLDGAALCLPKDTTVRQVSTVVERYLHDNPARLGMAASSLVAEALREQFPCPDR
jgi:Rap1a immunity proteins